MADTSVMKVCPHCGQSVPISAKTCTSCGKDFFIDESDFVAFECVRQTEALDPSKNRSDTPEAVPSDGAEERIQEGTDINFAVPVSGERVDDKQNGNRKARAQSGVGAGKKDDLHVTAITAVAAVLLIAVIVIAVSFAVKSGENDPEASDGASNASMLEVRSYAEIIEELEAKIADGNATAEDYINLAEAYKGNDEPREAADAYLRGFLEFNDSSLKREAVVAFLKLGDEKKTTGDYSGAEECYHTVLTELDPGNATAIAGLEELAKLEGGTEVEEAPISSPTPSVQPTIQPPGPSSDNTETERQLAEENEIVVTPTPAPEPTPMPTATPTPASTPAPTVVPAPVSTAAPTPEPDPYPVMVVEHDGSSYDLYAGTKTWWEAEGLAEELGGHLTTFTSEEEFQLLCDEVERQGLVCVWLGACRSEWESGIWHTGEPFDALGHWLPDEMNTIGGGDSLALIKLYGVWYLVDAPNNATEFAGQRGYIIEYN